MNNTNTGGPAFLCDHLVDEDGVSLAPDMTLRDYFAAKALQWMLAENGGGALTNDQLAKLAYALADAMLAAREAA